MMMMMMMMTMTIHGDSPRIVDVHIYCWEITMENIMGDNGNMYWTYRNTMGIQWDIMGI